MGALLRGFAVPVLAVLVPAALAPVVPAATAFAAEVRHAVPVGDSPAIGSADAPVVIVEFLDYQ